jgi:hypothetical protein
LNWEKSISPPSIDFTLKAWILLVPGKVKADNIAIIEIVKNCFIKD